MIGNLNKKIVLLFLSFLPLIGLGQDFDFHDIKTINSENIFKKFALENLFQRHKLDSYTLRMDIKFQLYMEKEMTQDRHVGLNIVYYPNLFICNFI